MTSKDKSKEGSTDRLESTLKRFNDSWDYQKDNWHERWNRDNKLYDGERHKRSYIGMADTFVPMTQPMIETMTSALANGTLRFDFTSGDPLKDPDTRALNGLIDEWWESQQWDLNTEEGIREMLITGMEGNMLSWNIDHPEWDVYAMRDVIVDPTIKSPAELQQPGAYAGRRYYVRKGALDDFEKVDVDPKSKTYGQLVKRYSIPTDTGPATGNAGEEDADDKKLKEEMFSGSTLSHAADDQDEIIEIWDIDRVVTIMNRKHVIEDVCNPYKQRHQDLLTKKYTDELTQSLNGMTPASTIELATRKIEEQAKAEARGIVPFFFFRNYRRASLFYAKSEIDAIAPHQELLNDLTNLETDMLIKQNSPQWALDPDYEDLLDDLDITEPDAVLPITPGMLQPVPRPQLSPNLFSNRMNIKNEIRETTAIGQGAKGVESSKDKTAAEVRSVDHGTGQRVESKARILEKDGFFWMARILYRMTQLYVTEPMVVRVSGPATKGKETGVYMGKQLPRGTAVFDPAEYEGDFIPTISLEIDSEAEKEKTRERAMTEYQMLIQDPTNNLPAAKKTYYPKIFDMDKADLDEVLTPDAAMAQADPMMGGVAPGMESAGV